MKEKLLHGQVLLITVLVLSIAVTIALSLIGRTSSDISMSRNVEESARAFSAAEAGIEQALQGTFIPNATVYTTGVSYQSSSKIIGGTSDGYTMPSTNVGNIQSLWLVEHTDQNTIDETQHYQGTSIDVCWALPQGSSVIPAIEIVLYYKTAGGEYVVTRGAYDPDLGARPATNFLAVDTTDGTCGTVTGVYKKNFPIPVGITPLLLRVRPFYSATTITIAPVGTSLPTQGLEISSIGKTDSGVTRKIVVKRQWPWPSSIFDYSLYSQDTLIH